MTVLRTIRENLGFSQHQVASATGLSLARLAAAEIDDDLDHDEATTLGDVYGVDVGDALEAGSATLPPVAALLRGDGAVLSVTARFEICEAATVARTARWLQAQLGDDNGWSRVLNFAADDDYRHPKDGAPDRLASRVRAEFRLGSAPILSVTDQLLRPLGVLVLSATLDEKVDAFCFGTPETGAVIVLNRRGEHTQAATGRRITLAHELCHLLFDRPKMQGMNRFCAIAYPKGRKGVARDAEDSIERRARAFSACLLAPTDGLREAWSGTRDLELGRRVEHLMTTFGVGYLAARARLNDVQRIAYSGEIAIREPSSAMWNRADPSPELNAAALASGVSPLRAGPLFDLLLRAHASGLVIEGYVRENLRVDMARWQEVGGKLGFTPQATFRTSASLDWTAD